MTVGDALSVSQKELKKLRAVKPSSDLSKVLSGFYVFCAHVKVCVETFT